MSYIPQSAAAAALLLLGLPAASAAQQPAPAPSPAQGAAPAPAKPSAPPGDTAVNPSAQTPAPAQPAAPPPAAAAPATPAAPPPATAAPAQPAPAGPGAAPGAASAAGKVAVGMSVKDKAGVALGEVTELKADSSGKQIATIKMGADTFSVEADKIGVQSGAGMINLTQAEIQAMIKKPPA